MRSTEPCPPSDRTLRSFGLLAGALTGLVFGLALPLLLDRPISAWPWLLGGTLALAGLAAGDAQPGVEGFQQAVGVRHGLLGQIGVTAVFFRFGAQQFQAVAQPRQGRAQVVGDAVGDAPHVVHQFLDAIEHGVEVGGQGIKFIATVL